MLGATGFENNLHAGLANVQIDTFTNVFDFDQVCALTRKEGEKVGESTRAVGDARKNEEPPTCLRFVASYESRKKTQMDVATR